MHKAIRIAALNDELRQTFTGGRVHMSSGIAALPEDARAQTLEAVRTFNTWTKGNDPHGEHDFGSIEVGGRKIFWKIDYYDKALEAGSEDPSDPEQTTRVLTIMLASEY